MLKASKTIHNQVLKLPWRGRNECHSSVFWRHHPCENSTGVDSEGSSATVCPMCITWKFTEWKSPIWRGLFGWKVKMLRIWIWECESWISMDFSGFRPFLVQSTLACHRSYRRSLSDNMALTHWLSQSKTWMKNEKKKRILAFFCLFPNHSPQLSPRFFLQPQDSTLKNTSWKKNPQLGANDELGQTEIRHLAWSSQFP